jgi:Sortilin, neurotensin receptor 3,
MNTVQRWFRFALPLLMLPLLVVTVRPQNAPAPPPPVINASTDPLLASFHFRSIGPASMGGRIDDIAVSESDPSIIYVGYAVGGVFKSENNGVSFEPVFQTYATASIGDIAIHPTNPNIVYVGTGEANNRQTSSFGDGLYKTTDGGKTFTRLGLAETQTIARIVIDPKNPETVYVASPGHLFGPSPDRGIYKSTDGGRTWNKVKFIEHDLRRQLSAAPQRLLLQRRRPWQRLMEEHRRRQDVDAPQRARLATRNVRADCTRRLAFESQRCLRPDRGRRSRKAGADSSG